VDDTQDLNFAYSKFEPVVYKSGYPASLTFQDRHGCPLHKSYPVTLASQVKLTQTAKSTPSKNIYLDVQESLWAAREFSTLQDSATLPDILRIGNAGHHKQRGNGVSNVFSVSTFANDNNISLALRAPAVATVSGIDVMLDNSIVQDIVTNIHPEFNLTSGMSILTGSTSDILDYYKGVMKWQVDRFESLEVQINIREVNLFATVEQIEYGLIETASVDKFLYGAWTSSGLDTKKYISDTVEVLQYAMSLDNYSSYALQTQVAITQDAFKVVYKGSLVSKSVAYTRMILDTVKEKMTSDELKRVKLFVNLNANVMAFDDVDTLAARELSLLTPHEVESFLDFVQDFPTMVRLRTLSTAFDNKDIIRIIQTVLNYHSVDTFSFDMTTFDGPFSRWGGNALSPYAQAVHVANEGLYNIPITTATMQAAYSTDESATLSIRTFEGNVFGKFDGAEFNIPFSTDHPNPTVNVADLETLDLGLKWIPQYALAGEKLNITFEPTNTLDGCYVGNVTFSTETANMSVSNNVLYSSEPIPAETVVLEISGVDTASPPTTRHISLPFRVFERKPIVFNNFENANYPASSQGFLLGGGPFTELSTVRYENQMTLRAYASTNWPRFFIVNPELKGKTVIIYFRVYVGENPTFGGLQVRDEVSRRNVASNIQAPTNAWFEYTSPAFQLGPDSDTIRILRRGSGVQELFFSEVLVEEYVAPPSSPPAPPSPPPTLPPPSSPPPLYSISAAAVELSGYHFLNVTVDVVDKPLVSFRFNWDVEDASFDATSVSIPGFLGMGGAGQGFHITFDAFYKAGFPGLVDFADPHAPLFGWLATNADTVPDYPFYILIKLDAPPNNPTVEFGDPSSMALSLF
jgi:hypothetical protein